MIGKGLLFELRDAVVAFYCFFDGFRLAFE